VFGLATVLAPLAHDSAVLIRDEADWGTHLRSGSRATAAVTLFLALAGALAKLTFVRAGYSAWDLVVGLPLAVAAGTRLLLLTALAVAARSLNALARGSFYQSLVQALMSVALGV